MDGSVRLELSRRIASCKAALAAGNEDKARALALAVRSRARQLRLADLEAEAVYRLATCHMAQSAHAEAREFLREAAQRFGDLGDQAKEAVAWSVLAATCSSLGDYEEAVGAARRAQYVAEKLPPTKTRLVVLINAGIVYADVGAFDEAQESFATAARLARVGQHLEAQSVLRANAAHLTISRARYEREFGCASVPRTLIEGCLRECEGLVVRSVGRSLSAWTRAALLANIVQARALLGDFAGALAGSSEALQLAEGLSSTTAIIGCTLAIAEASLGAGDNAAAESAADRAVALAKRLGNTFLQGAAHRLRSRVYETAGRLADALAEERAFSRAQSAEIRRRSTNIAQAQAWREAVVQKEKAVTALEAERAHLEALSLHDTLTGLKNRRFLDEFVRRELQSGVALTVALVDVDRFKAINDNFSHRVGDEVLVGIARAMTSCLRETDFAVRLAGDEFVIVMPGANAKAAEGLRHRLKETVRNRDWASIAPGLPSVSISIGLAHARPGDSLEALVEAADREMYADKRRSRGLLQEPGAR
ncbi:MAG TPA: tetratricopeptide repeat-containing diguanylate cyclase [Burkholderiaceae bacterium]|nr:tetratricopeptide repeat-containing diguanylate cyclase [Burkholderiaceae bacterium]